MSGAVTLELLAKQQTSILEEFGNMRADHAVLQATLQRMDAAMTGLLSEMRALHEQIDRVGDRVRRLEGRAVP